MLGLGSARRRPALEALVAALEAAELHGHGGASFPTATKLAAVAAQGGRPVVVVNGCEGEPLSRKDRFLLTRRTDEVLDGALHCAEALGADTVMVGVERRRVRALEALDAWLAAHPERRDPAVAVVEIPEGYVSGQESALINALNGREAKPTATPPYPFERGYRQRPTFVLNAETAAQVSRIAAGTYDGSRLVTVSGASGAPTVVAIRPGHTVADAFAAAGAGTESLRAVLLGGYAGTWVSAPAGLSLRLHEPTLRDRGLTLGAGIVHGLGRHLCPVSEVARTARYLADESAGQCGPCVFGLDAIAGALEVLTDPARWHRTAADELARVERWSAMVARRGGCAHPDGAVRYVGSALRVFAPEFEDHVHHGPCDRCTPAPALVTGAPVGASR